MSVQTPASLRARLNLDVRIRSRVSQIDTTAQSVSVVNEETGQTYVETYDHLILAVGAIPFVPPIPGIDRKGLFSLRNLQDMDAITAWIESKMKTMNPEDMHCVVAGAGFIGIEMVEQLHRRKMNVTLVEAMPQILGPMDPEMAAILHKDLEDHGVDVVVNDPIQAFAEDPNDPDASILTLKSGKVFPPAQLTILGLGVRPDTEMIKAAGIAVTPRGHIVVDEMLRTSVPNVWAVGDAVEVINPVLGSGATWAVPLAGPANRQGRMVADNILLPGVERKYKGTWAVSVVRSFEEVAACVGMNEKFLASQNIPYACIHTHPADHASYYPGATQMHMKLCFDPTSGKVFGAQCVGKHGVDKRIDVIATAMQGNMTVHDLAELELCYAPPVGSAKDAINMIGMAASNIVEGLVKHVDHRQLENLAHDPGTLVLDVRNEEEIATTGQIATTAMNIPLNDLRGRISELPRGKKIVVSCASGQRAYYGCRILMQNGFTEVFNLDGAYGTFRTVHSKPV